MDPSPRPSLRHYLPTLAALALVYYAAARLGLRYASIGQSVSLVWPPTGIAFAAMLLLGDRYWAGVALGAFFANAATDVPVAAALGIAIGNTLEALVAAHLFRRVAGADPELDNLRHVRGLVLVAAPLAAFTSAAIGVATLWATGVLPVDAAPSAALVWWIGDLLGALVVAPVFLTWATRARDWTSGRGILETAALCLGTAIAAEVGLGLLFHTPLVSRLDYTYLLFPFVVWAALRFGPRGASLVTLTVSTVAVWHTVQGAGPFVADTARGTLFAVSCYLVVVAVTGLGLAAAAQWERQQATAALQESEGRLNLALDAARMGIWFWSIETNQVAWDGRLRELFALPADEHVATYEDFLTRVHPDDRATVQESVQRAIRDEQELNYEFRIVLPDGQVRWVADHGRVGRDEQGRPAYLTGVCADVTERRTAEQRLRLAQRMDSVGKLAGGVAHEANNQMNVVLGASDFVLRHPELPEVVRADVTQIRRAAERTAAVTAQLLAFSRRQVMRPEVLDLNAMLKDWGPVVRRLVGADCIVTFQLADDVQPIKTDPGQLEQVLLNLALNARDAMSGGGHLIIETFAAELTDADAREHPDVAIRRGAYTALAVSDTGHGMDKATLDHIFEPFFTTKAAGNGSGLGLSTVYGIVKQSNGYIWADSEPGRGATFKIYLPVTAEPIRSPRSSRPLSRASAGESILVVEDEPQVRTIARRALQAAGYRVLEAVNGRQALDLLRQAEGRVDLVLTDTVMPEMNGRELAAQVAALAPAVPIVFTSGYPDGEIISRGLLADGAPFIQKPFTPDAIVDLVYRTLSARGDHSGLSRGETLGASAAPD